jgi:hypothetical protein
MDSFPVPAMTESLFASSRGYLSERNVHRYVVDLTRRLQVVIAQPRR